MKKAAILYSGQPRDIRECCANHVHHLIRNNPDFDFDIFGHIWIDHDNPFWDIAPERGSWKDDDAKFMLKNWKPKRIVFESPKSFKSNLTPNPACPHPVQNIMSMLYSVEQANIARNEYEKQEGVEYDCVIRLRTDVYFGDNADIKLSTLDLRKINVVERGAHRDYGCNDQFAISNSANMNAHSTTFSSIDKLVEMGCIVNPECLVGYNSFVHHGIDCDSHKRDHGDKLQFTLHRDRYASYNGGCFNREYEL